MNNQGVLVVGGGLAGLTLALQLAPQRVTVLAPRTGNTTGSSGWAQGGLAAALASGDSPRAHAADTIEAGGGLNSVEAVALVTQKAPQMIKNLVQHGVAFDRDHDGNLHMGLEGAHSQPRIVHAEGDRTGPKIMAALQKKVAQAEHINMITNMRAKSLLQDQHGRIAGVAAIDDLGQEQFLNAQVTILASGGLGHLYGHTTNPTTIRGDMLGSAIRAGAQLSDLEFVQFHPTAMAVTASPLPLVSEALRGAGARLVLSDGGFLFPGLGDLAARDEVARKIHESIHRGAPVFLDAGPIGDDVSLRFPTVAKLAGEHGLDLQHDLLPVAPAQHYHMGGVTTDLKGQSSLEHLYVIGETACTGLHGANRLASNSLLEALVFAHEAAEDLAGREFALPGKPTPPDKLLDDCDELPDLMDKHAGVVREEAGLKKIIDRLFEHCQGQIQLLSARDLAGLSIAVAARARKNSIGGHYRIDHPEPPTNKDRKAWNITRLTKEAVS